jgi:glycosyltransferase involved in cell wall biosynthesis
MSATPDAALQATVLITTRNRCEALRTALRSAVAQTVDVEVIVLDDASSDGTAEMVRREFPQVRVERAELAVGGPSQRNRGFAIARSPIVVCLDDDAWFSSPQTVAQVLAEFDDPAVGVVTIPYINVRREDWVRQRARDDGRWAAGTYAGGASALRREAFLDAGGYADFFEQGEETDLAIRLLERGHVVRLGRADHIVHDEVQAVKPAANYRFSSRNHLIGVWRNVPWPYLPGRLAVVAVKVALVGFRNRQPRAALRGVREGLRACAAGEVRRAPVRRSTYVLSRRLVRRGPMPLTEATDTLGPSS